MLLKLLRKVTFPQLSAAVGAEGDTTALHTPASLLWVTLDGQEIVGFSLSSTVTSNEQVAVLPALSVAVKTTVVVPNV